MSRTKATKKCTYRYFRVNADAVVHRGELEVFMDPQVVRSLPGWQAAGFNEEYFVHHSVLDDLKFTE